MSESQVLTIKYYGKIIQELTLEPGQSYTFGRASSNSVVLSDSENISRTHCKLEEVNGIWTFEMISLYDNFKFGEEEVQTVRMTESCEFAFSNYSVEFRIQSSKLPENEEVKPNNEDNSIKTEAFEGPEETFAFSEEKTLVAQDFEGQPQLRFLHPTRKEVVSRLRGKKWIAGRGEDVDIFLDDSKASRKQFEITKSSQGSFIRDLGSSNGTSVNSAHLDKDELRILNSGDMIKVGKLIIIFELKDPYFEQRLQNLSPKIGLAATTPPTTENPPKRGAIRLEEKSSKKFFENPKNTGTLILISFIGIFLWIQLGKNNSSHPPDDSLVHPQMALQGIGRLHESEQEYIKKMYRNGQRLYNQGRYASAVAHFRRIHDLLPEGYENSRILLEESRSAIENEERLRAMALERQRQLEQQAQIRENLIKCEKLSQHTQSVPKIRECLIPTIENDPDNPKIDEFIQIVENRISSLAEAEATRRRQQERINSGRNLFLQADALQKKGETWNAIAAFEKHISANYPDPNNLKSQSRKAIREIRSQIENRIQNTLREARALYSQKNYRQALNKTREAQKIQTDNKEIQELRSKIIRKLNAKMREIYQQAVIAEGLGQLELAVELWEEIIEKDHPIDGEYYPRAKSKLQLYKGHF